jgi:hypothetical protein
MIGNYREALVCKEICYKLSPVFKASFGMSFASNPLKNSAFLDSVSTTIGRPLEGLQLLSTIAMFNMFLNICQWTFQELPSFLAATSSILILNDIVLTKPMKWHLRLGHPDPEVLEHLVDYSRGARIKKKSDRCAPVKARRRIRRQPKEFIEGLGEHLTLDFHDFEPDSEGYSSPNRIINKRELSRDLHLRIEPSAPYTQDQNGAAKRLKGMILDMGISSCLPSDLRISRCMVAKHT